MIRSPGPRGLWRKLWKKNSRAATFAKGAHAKRNEAHILFGTICSILLTMAALTPTTTSVSFRHPPEEQDPICSATSPSTKAPRSSGSKRSKHKSSVDGVASKSKSAAETTTAMTPSNHHGSVPPSGVESTIAATPKMTTGASQATSRVENAPADAGLQPYDPAIVCGEGCYQRMALFCGQLAGFVFLSQHMSILLTTTTVDHWCKPPPTYANLSPEGYKNISIPREEDGSYSHCTFYDPPLTVPSLNRSIQYCSSWDFDRDVYSETLVTRWSLVCDRSGLVSLYSAMYMSGAMAAVPVAGQSRSRQADRTRSERLDQPGTIAERPSPPPLRGGPGCPPGLEYLAIIDQVIIQQTAEAVEVVTRWGSSSKYTAKNNQGQFLYNMTEDSTCCARQCCGSKRCFEMHVLDVNNEEVMRFVRPLRCTSCIWFCCLQNVEVQAPPGITIGFVQEDCTICYPSFSICDETGVTVLRVSGPFCTTTCVCCGDVKFKVHSSEGEEAGVISKQWPGIDQEAFADADNFGVCFPLDLDVRVKATLLGCAVLIDEIGYVMRTTRSDHEEICTLLFGHMCGVLKSPEDIWEVHLPERKPNDRSERRLQKRDDNQEVRVLHLWDTHFDPHHLPGSLAECDEPLCWTATKRIAGGWTVGRLSPV